MFVATTNQVIKKLYLYYLIIN